MYIEFTNGSDTFYIPKEALDEMEKAYIEYEEKLQAAMEEERNKLFDVILLISVE